METGTHTNPAAPAVDCSAAILAGGGATRMNGANKALLTVGGRPILDCILETLRPIFSHILIVSNDPLAYLSYDAAAYSDLSPIRCSLNGLVSALSYAPTQRVLLVPCDLPFVKPAMIRLLLEEAQGGVDVVTPQTQMGMEPLLAVYSKRCLEPARRMLAARQLHVRGFFSQVRVKTLYEPRLRAVDPELESFFNVNTPQELQKAQAREV